MESKSIFTNIYAFAAKFTIYINMTPCVVINNYPKILAWSDWMSTSDWQ